MYVNKIYFTKYIYVCLGRDLRRKQNKVRKHERNRTSLTRKEHNNFENNLRLRELCHAGDGREDFVASVTENRREASTFDASVTERRTLSSL